MDVFGDGKTSLRGGYGLFFSTTQETFAGNLEQQPFTLAVTLTNTNSFTNPYAGVAPYNGKSPFPYVVNLQSPNFVFNQTTVFAGLKPNSSTLPYVQAYNLTFEQQYGPDWSTRIAYIGNGGRHFYFARDTNAPLYSPTGSTSSASIAARRPMKGYGTIALLDPSSNSSYNSLQLPSAAVCGITYPSERSTSGRRQWIRSLPTREIRQPLLLQTRTILRQIGAYLRLISPSDSSGTSFIKRLL